MEISIPDILKETTEDIHARMLSKAPKNINILEGDVFWDATRPSAEEISRLKNIDMQSVFKMAFPQSATGKHLEYIGEYRGIFKNPPTKSMGYIKFKGNPNTFIPNKSIISTISDDVKESIEFETIESAQVNETGEVVVKIRCLIPGIIGNVKAHTITILVSQINGIKEVINEDDLIGGTDIEDEEHFRQRIMEAEQNDFLSGSDSDYERWAKEVDGVGQAYVIEECNGPGTVKLLILDKNYQIANEDLLKRVKEYIYPDKREGENRRGKAPVGAKVTISTPSILKINVQASFKFSNNYSTEIILNDIKNKIANYLKKIKINGVVNYNAIYSIVGSYILTNEGIEDFTELKINDEVSNITLVDQVAVIGDVINV
ncbi:baseplate J/gp47 family protein [Clostridium senegalense]|uniref:baseplate J/gp47 family protein n=1 Tax=Clostridium senegalense TaxID=1465809 RepID=UPI00028834EB|nr:baseplate J/gp47 family protein [Clostridium senegalense]